MLTTTARTPAGDTFAVTVRAVPRWRPLARRLGGWRRRENRRRSKDRGSWLDTLDVPWVDSIDDLLVGIAVVVGLIIFGLVFWWLLLPLVLLLLDGLVVLLLVVLGALTRVALRRPWTVEVRRRTPADVDEDVDADVVGLPVVGWRRALRTRDAVADRVRSGQSSESLAAFAATVR
ncbi:hypothetical protein [Angustibacter luteus]|uniref:Uncharacterized protein n=1 Tax=Angustibacter luteus TaxID=658456 RepID=A0ABW1J9B7_9ACTN